MSIKFPDQLNIIIRTSIPGFQEIEYKPSMTIKDTFDKAVIFNPLIKLNESVVSKIPQEYKIKQFFNKGLFQSLLNYNGSRPAKDLIQATRYGYVDNNINVTLNSIFPVGSVIYIGYKPYVIADHQWTTGDWKIKGSEAQLRDFPNSVIVGNNYSGPPVIIPKTTTRVPLPSIVPGPRLSESAASAASSVASAATAAASVAASAAQSATSAAMAAASVAASAISSLSTGPTGDTSTVTGPTGDASTVTGPTGDASTVTGPTGDASTVTGPTGDASTVAGPTGDASTVTGPTGDASTVAGPTGDASTVAGPTGDASTVAGPEQQPTTSTLTVHGHCLSIKAPSSLSLARQPNTEVLVQIEGPATQGPTTEGPATEGPATQGPATEGPATEGPATEGPTTTDTSLPLLPTSIQEPTTTDTSLSLLPTTTEGPTTEGPTSTETSLSLLPTTEGPTTEGPTTEGPTTEGPTTEGPTTEGPTTEGPTTEGPTTEGPTTAGPWEEHKAEEPWEEHKAEEPWEEDKAEEPSPQPSKPNQTKKKECPSEGINPVKCNNKKDYYKQSLIFHPDKNKDCQLEATDKFQRLQNLCESVNAQDNPQSVPKKDDKSDTTPDKQNDTREPDSVPKKDDKSDTTPDKQDDTREPDSVPKPQKKTWFNFKNPFKNFKNPFKNANGPDPFKGGDSRTRKNQKNTNNKTKKIIYPPKPAYVVVIDMELHPGTSLTPEQLNESKCNSRYNSIRKAFSQFTGTPYVIPPVYTYKPSQTKKIVGGKKNKITRKRR